MVQQQISPDIIAAAAGGDRAAFEVIYRACNSFVYNVAWKVTRDAQDAEDITQEVFVILYHKLKEFRFESSLLTWVYRITANRAINYAKQRSRVRKKTVEFDDTREVEVEAPEPVAAEPDIDKTVLISRMLDRLDPDYRVYIVLREVEGLSYEKISSTLKVNINTVRTRLRRARERLLAIKEEVEYELRTHKNDPSG